MQIAPERSTIKTLYSYIYEGLILKVDSGKLLLQGKRRKPKNNHRHHKNASFVAKSIIYRPKEASERQIFGHWETDTVTNRIPQFPTERQITGLTP